MDEGVIQMIVYGAIALVYYGVRMFRKKNEEASTDMPEQPQAQPSPTKKAKPVEDMLDEWIRQFGGEQNQDEATPATRKPAPKPQLAKPKLQKEPLKKQTYENKMHEERVQRRKQSARQDAIDLEANKEVDPLEGILDDNFDARKAFIYQTIFEKKQF